MGDDVKTMTISVVADDEVRVQNDGKYVQKLIHPKVGLNPEVYWTSTWVREIVSYLTECDYLQKRYPKFIEHLAWTAYAPVQMPTHDSLVNSLRMLLTVWLKDCVESETCIAPPSRTMLRDRELFKILKRYKTLKESMERDDGGEGEDEGGE